MTQKQLQNIQNIVTTMKIEGMDLDKDFINELIKVSNGEKTSEQLRQEVLKKIQSTIVIFQSFCVSLHNFQCIPESFSPLLLLFYHENLKNLLHL